MSEKTPDFCTAVFQKLQLERVTFKQTLSTSSKVSGTFARNKEDYCNFRVMGDSIPKDHTYITYQKKIFTCEVPSNERMVNCPIWPKEQDNMISYFLKNLAKYDPSNIDRDKYISLFLNNLIYPEDLNLNLLPDVFFFYKDPDMKDSHFFLNTFAKIFFTVFITIILFYINLRTYLFINRNELDEPRKNLYANILECMRPIINERKEISLNERYRHYLTMYKQITTNGNCAEIFKDSINNTQNVSFPSEILLSFNSFSIRSDSSNNCHVEIEMNINKENLKKMIGLLSSKTESYLKIVKIPVDVEPDAEKLTVRDKSYNYSITFDQFLKYSELYHGRNVHEKNSETESLTKVTKFLEYHLGIRNVSTLLLYRNFKSNITTKNFQNAVFNFFQFWFLENNKKTGEYFLDEFYNDWGYVRNSILFLIELIKKSKNFDDSKIIVQDEKFSYILTEIGGPTKISDLKSFFKLNYIEPEHKEVKCKWSFSYVSQPFDQTQEIKPQLHFFLFIAKCLNHNPLQYISGFEYIPTETIS
jgi:hypothetical protein